MSKILVLDHVLNCESMASCSIEYSESKFFGLNTSISIDDNLEACKPDILFINQHFITKELLYQMQNKFGNKTRVYYTDYLIPNYYVKQDNNSINDKICVISLHENHTIDSNKFIKINDQYAAVYSYRTSLIHPQFVGLFDHAKDLFRICQSRNTVLDASGGYLEGFCKFYGWNYGVFKPNGTMSITKAADNIKTYLSNKEIYEQNM